MAILTVPNWSFGRDQVLLERFREALSGAGVRVHYAASDEDHNRTVTAFSGEESAVDQALFALCQLAFSHIDMRRHEGVHPRVGALDVCPFIPLDTSETGLISALSFAERIAAKIAGHFGIPIYLYERSERGRHEADLPTLRKGGFEGLTDRTLRPDFGPSTAHPLLGATVVGVRDFLIAMNVDLATQNLELARTIAREIRDYRADGDPRFLGVRALGFPLASRGIVQVSLNLTLPDLTPVDPIIDWIEIRAAEEGVVLDGTELIGVIRSQDVARATELPIDPAQIID